MTTQNSPLTLTVREALEQGSGAAEKQLIAIGNDHGDAQLAVIVGDLTVPEIIVMSDEYDMTKPSLISAFITSEQFNGALDRKSQEWGGKYGCLSQEDLNSYLQIVQEDVECFICPIVYSGDDSERESQMLHTLFAHPHGTRLVLVCAIGRKDFHEMITSTNEPEPATHGTWQSLLTSLRHQRPKEFKEFIDQYHEENQNGEKFLRIAQSILQDIAAETRPIAEDKKADFLTF
jgi:hypothetical protein